jgi:hypothetical protein
MDDQKKKKIEAAIVLVAQIITKREDGSKYLPVYDRLQAELIALSSQNDRLDQIRKVAMGERAAA